MIANYPYNSTHLLKSLEWVDRLAPDASDAVRLATLTHDMERAFGGPDAIPIKLNDRAYEEAHSNRSAESLASGFEQTAQAMSSLLPSKSHPRSRMGGHRTRTSCRPLTA